MTNEEKTRELIRESCDMEDALLQMAEWKDDKFFAILACIKFSLEKQVFSADVFVEGIQKQWEE